jgi:hypothetical protein
MKTNGIHLQEDVLARLPLLVAQQNSQLKIETADSFEIGGQVVKAGDLVPGVTDKRIAALIKFPLHGKQEPFPYAMLAAIGDGPEPDQWREIVLLGRSDHGPQ